MSTFGFETQLLLPVAEIGCKFVLATDKGQEKTSVMREYSGFKNWTVIFPEKKNKGYGVFHTKLWLIKFEGFLWVVVGTGNLHLADWAVWSNAFWWKDFKSNTIGSKEECPLAKDFKSTLQEVFSAMIP